MDGSLLGTGPDALQEEGSGGKKRRRQEKEKKEKKEKKVKKVKEKGKKEKRGRKEKRGERDRTESCRERTGQLITYKDNSTSSSHDFSSDLDSSDEVQHVSNSFNVRMVDVHATLCNENCYICWPFRRPIRIMVTS